MTIADQFRIVSFVLTIGALMQLITVCNGHGRLMEPPGRSSAWRVGFKTPTNYDDDQLYCGGLTHQRKNGGKCGVCGDPYDWPEPRPNEYGGKYGRGVIVRKYTPGSEITIRILLTTSHMGYFEFRVCNDAKAQQDCLDKGLMEIVSGTPSSPRPTDLKTRFYPRHGSRMYEIQARLPEGVEGGNCLLQWRYTAGNNWGICSNGRGAMGCGPQEEFRGCADVTIGDYTPEPPLHDSDPTDSTDSSY